MGNGARAPMKEYTPKQSAPADDGGTAF